MLLCVFRRAYIIHLYSTLLKTMRHSFCMFFSYDMPLYDYTPRYRQQMLDHASSELLIFGALQDRNETKIIAMEVVDQRLHQC